MSTKKPSSNKPKSGKAALTKPREDKAAKRSQAEMFAKVDVSPRELATAKPIEPIKGER